MPDNTRVRLTKRQPVATPQWTIGEHVPTALARLAAGKARKIAAHMGVRDATVYKWYQCERGPEFDLRRLFPAMRAAGVSLEDAMLLVVEIEGLCRATYGDDLPKFSELHQSQDAADLAEDQQQNLIRDLGQDVETSQLFGLPRRPRARYVPRPNDARGDRAGIPESRG